MKILCCTGSHIPADAAFAPISLIHGCLVENSHTDNCHPSVERHNLESSVVIHGTLVIISFHFFFFFFPLRHEFLWLFPEKWPTKDNTDYLWQGKVSNSTVLVFHAYPLIPFYLNFSSTMWTKKQFQIL